MICSGRNLEQPRARAQLEREGRRIELESMATTESRQQGVALGRWIPGSAMKALGFLLVAMSMDACSHPQPERQPVTLSYFRLGWAQPDELPTAVSLSERFTRETGIQLKSIPVPETTLDQLDVSRKLLESTSSPDVLGLDLIWSGVLQGDLIDLRPYLSQEISSIEPQLLPSYTVDGRLVAIPYTVQVGVLEYRTDLLREYGYDHPPKSWSELERMALRIQSGERAKGQQDFWGYAWQGADAEALTCNALEWQVDEGGGRIIEDDHTISVNNPGAIRAWGRGKRWIGWISPPGVLAYREIDTINLFDTGKVAFNRVWGGRPSRGEAYIANCIGGVRCRSEKRVIQAFRVDAEGGWPRWEALGWRFPGNPRIPSKPSTWCDSSFDPKSRWMRSRRAPTAASRRNETCRRFRNHLTVPILRPC